MTAHPISAVNGARIEAIESEFHRVRPAGHVDFDRLARFVHGMELELGFAILRVEEDDAVAIETVAGSIHGHLVAEAIVKLTGVFEGSEIRRDRLSIAPRKWKKSRNAA